MQRDKTYQIKKAGVAALTAVLFLQTFSAVQAQAAEENGNVVRNETVEQTLGGQAAEEQTPDGQASGEQMPDGQEPGEQAPEDENVVQPPRTIDDVWFEAKNNHTVRILWNPSQGAQQYEVYRREKTGGAEYLLIGTSEKEKFIDETVKEKTDYSYKIVPVAIAQDQRVPGKGRKAEYKYSLYIPSALQGLHVDVRSGSKLELYWKESEIADRYFVYRKQKEEKAYKLLKDTGKLSYVDTAVKAGVDYCYKVVPAYKENGVSVIGDGAETSIIICDYVDTGHQKYTYSEMKTDLEQLQKAYSRHCQINVIGKSVQGRNIYDVVIGNPDAKKCFLVVSTLHAREYIASMLCMEQIEYYLKNYHAVVDGRKVSDVLDQVAIHYVVMANPDGVTLSQTKIPLLKNNANGVNLNDNFPYKFGVKDKPGSQFYSGPSAASEPETQAIVALCKSLNKSGLQAVLNYHATGSIVFGSYGGSDSKVGKMTTAMYQLARKTTGYRDSAGYSSGQAESKYSGSFRDYVMFKMNKPSITVEVGTTPCPISYKYLPSIWEKNKYLIIREAALFL